MTTSATITAEDVIDVFSDAGFEPAEVATGRIAGWIAERFDAWQPVEGGGHVVATHTDERIILTVLTESGVTESEARFDASPLGFRLFAAAMTAFGR